MLFKSAPLFSLLSKNAPKSTVVCGVDSIQNGEFEAHAQQMDIGAIPLRMSRKTMDKPRKKHIIRKNTKVQISEVVRDVYGTTALAAVSLTQVV